MFKYKLHIVFVASLAIATLMVKTVNASPLQVDETEAVGAAARAADAAAAGVVDVNNNKKEVDDLLTSRVLEEEDDFLTCGIYEGAPCCYDFKCKDPSLACDRVNEVCVSCGRGGVREEDGCKKGDCAEICCDGMKCEGGSECSIDGLCLTCGQPDGPCCKGEGPSCMEGYMCDVTETCVRCGSLLDPCCDGMKCAFEGEGNFPLVCNHMNECVRCGSTSVPCCEGMKCNPILSERRRLEMEEGTSLGRVCAPNGICVECGALNEACCGDGKPCFGALVCNANGLCSLAPSHA